MHTVEAEEEVQRVAAGHGGGDQNGSLLRLQGVDQVGQEPALAFRVEATFGFAER